MQGQTGPDPLASNSSPMLTASDITASRPSRGAAKREPAQASEWRHQPSREPHPACSCYTPAAPARAAETNARCPRHGRSPSSFDNCGRRFKPAMRLRPELQMEAGTCRVSAR